LSGEKIRIGAAIQSVSIKDKLLTDGGGCRTLFFMDLSRQLFDTHTHLTMPEYTDTLDAVLARSRMAGVVNWITIGSTLADSASVIELAGATEGLYGTVGVHPHEADKQERGWPKELARLARLENVRGIGETGLDYHYEFSPRIVQQKVFSDQLELAVELGLPVVVHCREALEDCLDILNEWRQREPRVVFHCFGGDRREARQVLDKGYYLSFTGIITFRNAAAAQEAARYAPLDRVMLETDCPYLSPAPKRSVRPNEPALLVHVGEKMAELKGIDLREVAEMTTATGRRFFDIESEA